MEHVSVQVQAIIYHNEKKDILRTINSFSRAVEISRLHHGKIDTAVMHFGDSSVEPIFTQTEIQELGEQYKATLSIKYTVFGFNSGTSKGHNLLAKDCESDYIVLMNPDIVPCPRFFIEMVEPFSRTSMKVGLVEARQTPIEHPKQYDPQTGRTPWASGACGMIPTKLFQELNGYDEQSFFLYCDDVDLSWRIRLLGYELIYQPLAPVFHAKRLTHGANMKPTSAEIYYSAESSLIMAYKWSNPQRLKELLIYFKQSKDEHIQKALQEYYNRKSAHALPMQLDPEHRIATFIDGNYAKHRFVL